MFSHWLLHQIQTNCWLTETDLEKQEVDSTFGTIYGFQDLRCTKTLSSLLLIKVSQEKSQKKENENRWSF